MKNLITILIAIFITGVAHADIITASYSSNTGALITFDIEFDTATDTAIWRAGPAPANTSFWTPTIDVPLIAVQSAQAGVTGVMPFDFAVADLADEASLIASGFGDVTNGWMLVSTVTLDAIPFQDSTGTAQTFTSNFPFLSVGGTAIDVAGGLFFSSGGQGLTRDEIGAFLPINDTSTGIFIPNNTLTFSSSAIPEPSPLPLFFLAAVGIMLVRRRKP